MTTPGNLTHKCQLDVSHCGRPMLCVNTRASWSGVFPDGATTQSARYVCRPCGATVDVTLVEPDQPVVGPARTATGEPDAGGHLVTRVAQVVAADQLVAGDQGDE